MPAITVDGRTIEAPGGSMVLDVVRSMGIAIPTLCSHPDIRPSGACGICVVEVSGPSGPRLANSCATEVSDGMTIRTDTPSVRGARRQAAGALLSRAPGSEAVRRIAQEMGLETGKHDAGGGKCIGCGNCEQACREIAGSGIIGSRGHGAVRIFGIFDSSRMSECHLCGACAQVCPTGTIDVESRASALLRASGGRLSCRHERLGLVSNRLCSANFRCSRCEFDQNLRDAFGAHPAFVARPRAAYGFTSIEDFLFDPACEYGPGHLWSKRRNGVVRVGLDDIARRILGPISKVEVEHADSGVQEEVSITVRCRNGRTSNVAFPVPGAIESVNPLLSTDPSAPTRDPYRRGWLFDFRPNPYAPRDVRRFTGHTASLWFRKEAHEVKRLLNIDRKTRGGDGAFLWIDERSLAGVEWGELAGFLTMGSREAREKAVS